MPELPEVQAIKNQLNKYLQNHIVESVEVKNRRIFQGDEKVLVGAQFKIARRFGKVTSMDFDNGYSVVTHVKMTGQFVYRGPNLKNPAPLSPKVAGGVPGPHTHVIFTLNNGGKLYFNDLRRFAWMKVVQTAEVENLDFIKKLGPEPFKDLTKQVFKEIVLKNKRAIKVILMDQSKMGGIGNIYANDALFLAKIMPERKANTLTESETEKLYDAIIKVLETGIKQGGASENAFVTPDGTEGNYQDHSLVYARASQACQNKCGAKIKKIMLGGRGTFYCPNCQK
ncbi:MAG: bifunctional DNA-formamidopyrimidine glycosylase/DNA-(apurinic or apyrimidinic site) lyase [Patescibacteria group bacterium]